MVVTGPIVQPGLAGRYPLLAVELGARRRELAARVELPRNQFSLVPRYANRSSGIDGFHVVLLVITLLLALDGITGYITGHTLGENYE